MVIKIESLDKLLTQWNALNKSFLVLKEEKDQLENNITKILKENHWKDYRHDKVHVSLLEFLKEEIDQSELPLLLNRSDIEKITIRKTENKLLIVSDDSVRKYNKKLRRG